MNARETSTVEYISLQTFYFNLNILKFELEYERTPPQIFLAFFFLIWRFTSILSQCRVSPILSIVKNTCN